MPELSLIRAAEKDSQQRARFAFERLFSGEPTVFRAPGRVNLIGEHTDYNDGFVMPAAIGFYTYAAVARNGSRSLRVYSTNFDEKVEFDIDRFPKGRSGHWSDYVVGVAAVLLQAGFRIAGADLVISGEVPIGSGLSSSAALEVSTATALLAESELELERSNIAKMCQEAENEFTGARCGIMDQFISCFGRAGSALLLDCRSLKYELLEVGDSTRIVVCNSKVKHEIAGGEYNRRREACENSVRHLQKHLPAIRALRDVTLKDLERFGADLTETELRRSRHVITENQRVLSAAEALRRGSLQEFGRLMFESHSSLRDDYEVSCRELDLLVEFAKKLDGVLGARMTGGGFGGCTVNLVLNDNVKQFKAEMEQRYLAATSISPEIYICSPVDGASRVEG